MKSLWDCWKSTVDCITYRTKIRFACYFTKISLFRLIIYGTVRDTNWIRLFGKLDYLLSFGIVYLSSNTNWAADACTEQNHNKLGKHVFPFFLFQLKEIIAKSDWNQIGTFTQLCAFSVAMISTTVVSTHFSHHFHKFQHKNTTSYVQLFFPFTKLTWINN